ncbi:hypothetical protein SAMN05216227_102813 [Pseudorhodobacter antarcticus]|jgi:hypothetical protein|uniref:Uncharacterized protein n=1 Tax=Pseudorhodobacter antarcticus TaxID=1077947 RepID=A0A1H8JYM8_9RHOB|nr:hypothetical protein SAMN05216227_102813 [Pseudorhodobacter antarcticus]
MQRRLIWPTLPFWPFAAPLALIGVSVGDFLGFMGQIAADAVPVALKLTQINATGHRGR